jgi:hypothetical protein
MSMKMAERKFYGGTLHWREGKDLWAIKENNLYHGHPDLVFAAHILPSHKGKQVFYGREGWAEKKEKIGVFLADDQGNLLWANWGYNHIDQGWVSKIIPSQDGMQCFGLNIAEKEWSKAGMKYPNRRDSCGGRR